MKEFYSNLLRLIVYVLFLINSIAKTFTTGPVYYVLFTVTIICILWDIFLAIKKWRYKNEN
ncbi:hypothetical protein [Streptococcus dentiloxodontae]